MFISLTSRTGKCLFLVRLFLKGNYIKSVLCLKGSVTVRGIGMFMRFLEKNYKV